MDSKNRIVPKTNLKLRKIGNRYMLVETVDHAVNLTNVYSMNKTAAWLWEAVCQEEHLTSETLVERLCEVYPVEYDRARHDVERQLAEWEQMGLLLLS